MKNKDIIKKETIVYDIISIPDELSLEDVCKIYKISGFIIYDSNNKGCIPKTLKGDDIKFSLDINVPKNKKLLEKIKRELDAE